MPKLKRYKTFLEKLSKEYLSKYIVEIKININIKTNLNNVIFKLLIAKNKSINRLGSLNIAVNNRLEIKNCFNCINQLDFINTLKGLLLNFVFISTL